MTKILPTIILMLFTYNSFAQVNIKPNDNVTKLKTNTVEFRLFPTENIWNFIKLNTRNGQMWQVQFGLIAENRFVTNLSTASQVSKEEEVNDRFTLYSTQNMYAFILLDQFSGKTWQVQWSIDPNNRGVFPIE